METKFGVGEWKMRNGLKAVVLGSQPGNNGQPWVGYSYDELGNTGAASWKDDGSWISGLIHHCDLISPWTSPIAPGHNPDKLTEEQVGDGWWLPEWEVLEKLSIEDKQKHFECFWVSESTWRGSDKWSFNPINTYRTRLPRAELLALIAPKKRNRKYDELPSPCWIREKGTTRAQQVLAFDQCGFKVVSFGCEPVLMDIQWSQFNQSVSEISSDLRTWNSFEVEDKQ